MIFNQARQYIETHQKTLRTIAVWSVWIGAALAIRIFLFQPFNIPSGSMEPTLLVGDHLFVSKYAYGYSRFAFPFQSGDADSKVFSRVPRRGDVVVFRPPKDSGQDYIKRVIGLSGDRVQVKNSNLYLNGKRIPREKISPRLYRERLPNGVSYLTKDISQQEIGDNTPVYVVPSGHIFVMGDNRDNSTDSRFFAIGFIPLANLVGRAEIIYMSFGGNEEGESFHIRHNRLGQIIR